MIWIKFVFLAIFLVLSAFFSGTETAFFSLGKLKLNRMAKSENKVAQIVAHLLNYPRKLLTTILIGNMFVNIASSSLAENLSDTIFPAGGTWIAVLSMTFLILIFGEITPKTIAVQNSEKMSMFAARPLLFFQKIFAPIRFLAQFLSNFFIKAITGERGYRKQKLTQSELKAVVDIGFEEGVVDNFEREVIENVFRFANRTVKQIFTPRVQVKMLEASTSMKDAMAFLKKENFSKVPVYEEDEENIIGVLYSRDLILKNRKNIKELAQPAFFIPETKKIDQLLHEFKRGHKNFAIVIDEYGVFSGIITMDDILEEIVGETDNYPNKAAKFYNILPTHEILVEATMELEEFNRQFGTKLVDPTIQSIGGFIMNRLGRIPQTGESFKIGNLLFTIVHGKPNKIQKLKFRKL